MNNAWVISDINVVSLAATQCKFSGSSNNSKFSVFFFNVCIREFLATLFMFGNEALATFKISLLHKQYDI